MLDIKLEIKKLESELETAFKVYKNKKAEIEKEIGKLRESCQHPKATFYSDPSGNNDSYFSCDLCGKEAKRL